MPVRLKITLLFSLLVFIILSIVCTGIYFFTYKGRINTIKTRLLNRGITTARLLSQHEIFDQNMVQRIDTFTTLSLKNKSVRAYDSQDRLIYDYSDVPGDKINISPDILNRARIEGDDFFRVGKKEVVAHHYLDNNANIVVVTAGEDVEGKQNLKSLLNILILSFLIANIIVLGIGYVFSRRLLVPLKRIAKDAEEISAQNLTRRIETGTAKDEWYYLSNTLNQLLNRLQESFELQRRFISNASHELSTPLTSISSQLEVSLQRERSAIDYRNVMQSIYQDVLHMNKLTQTLLEFAKASGNAGGLDINLVRVDEVLLRLPSELIKIEKSFDVRLEFSDLPNEEEKLLVFGNEELLFTAIKNIVINACKYSANNQAIVNLNVSNYYINIQIRDKGPGISSQELLNIFQPFYRVNENRTEKGFGLGLSLADRIVRLHKGIITVQSELNKGTQFTIQLPGANYLRNIQNE